MMYLLAAVLILLVAHRIRAYLRDAEDREFARRMAHRYGLSEMPESLNRWTKKERRKGTTEAYRRVMI